MQAYTILIEGMGCENCVRAVTQGLQALGAQISLVEIGKAQVAYEGDAAALRLAVEDAGFDVLAIEKGA